MNKSLPALKGRMIHLAVAGLLGLLSVIGNPFLYGGLFIVAILYFYQKKKSPFSFIAILVFSYFAFSSTALVDKDQVESRLSGREKSFVILFKEGVSIDGDRLTGLVETNPFHEKVALQYRIGSEAEKNRIKKILLPGTACRSSGSLERPSPARNPHSFNYHDYLKRKDIYWIYRVDYLDLATCTEVPGDILTPIKRFRQKQLNRIEEFFPKEISALAAALIFGDRSEYDPNVEEAYRKIGVIHLLAISGLHVGLIAGMLYFVVIRIGVAKEKAEELQLIFLPVYAVATGLAPPVIRATSMVMMLVVAKRFRLRLTPLDAISIACMGMMFLKPSVIFETGFQLSFAVSFSLVISAERILSSFRTFLGKSAASSFIAQLASLPILLNEFHEISFISIAANLLFIPIFSFMLLPLMFIVYTVYILIGEGPLIFLQMIEVLVGLVNHLSQFLAEVPGAVLSTGQPPMSILVLMAIGIAAFFILWESSLLQRKKGSLRYFLLFLIPLLLQILLPFVNPWGHITFIDVGQGDSILIQLPFNQGNYLIDTGGTRTYDQEDWQRRTDLFEPGKDIVVPFLKAEGIRRIDKLILTHGDADHIGGALSVLDEMEVNHLILPMKTERSKLEVEVIRKAAAKGVDILLWGEGIKWENSGGKFSVLGPKSSGGDRNDRSIILLAELGGKKWLFTGDLGMEGEKELVEKYKWLKVDVLKVGHHGSKFSSSPLFLESIQSKTAIISVGAKNTYGHPGKEVLKRLQEAGTEIYRTDEDGAIIYKFRGDSGTFSTQIP